MANKLRKVVYSIAAAAIILGSVFAFSAPKALAANAYDYQLLSQSAYPATLAPGATTNVYIEVKNTGTAVWNSNVRLGSGSMYGAANQQRDYHSEFYDAGSWLSDNRPANMTDGTRQVAGIQPGWVVRFQFNIKAPTVAGTYKAYFTPVADGVSWMKDIGIYWQIAVAGDPVDPGEDPIIEPGSPLSVALSSTTPAVSNVPKNAQGVTFAKYLFTGGSTASTITNLIVKRVGAGEAADFTNVYLYDGDVRLTNGRSVNASTNEATFTGFSVTVPANGSKVLSVAADLNGTSSNANAFQIESASKITGSSSFNGSFPITGNIMQLTNATVGGIQADPSGSIVDPKIGETNVKIAEFKITGNGEDITLRRIALTNFGSISSSNLTGLSLMYNGSEVASSTGMVKDLATFVLNSPMTIANGSNRIFQLYANVTGRVGDTIMIGIDDDADVYATGNTYGYGVVLTNNYGSGSTSDSALIGGTLTITSSGPVANEISKDQQDKVFLNLAIASEVNAEIRNLVLRVVGATLTSGAGTAYYSDVKIMDGSNIVAGPKELNTATAGTQTLAFTDRFMIYAGETKNLTVTMDISNNTAITDGDDVSIDLVAFTGNDDIKNIDTNAYVTDANIVPSTDIVGKIMTIRDSGLSISLSSTPASQSVVVNKTAVDTVGFLFTAGAASDVTLTSVKFTGYIDENSGDGSFLAGTDVTVLRDVVSSVTLYNATTGAAVGSAKSLASDGTVVFSGLAINIPASGTVKLVPRVNVSASDSDCDFTFDIADASADVTSQDGNSNDITETGDAVNGGIAPSIVVTVTAAGTLNAQVSAATPVTTIAQAGATGVEFARVKYYAIGEAYTISELKVLNSGADVNITSITLTSGGTSVTGYLSGQALKFTNLGINVPKDSNTEVILTANMNTIAAGAVSGASLGLTVDEGDVAAGEFKATGIDSGAIKYRVDNFGSITDLPGNAMVVRKTKPVISSTSTSGTLAGTINIYSMTVAAGSGADASFKQFAFETSATFAGGTITGIEVYKDGAKVPTADLNVVTDNADDIIDTAETSLIISWKTGKELVVAQGTSSTIVVKGTSGVTGSSSFTARLAEENTTTIETNIVTDTVADGIYEINGGAVRNIIWSDNSSTSHNSAIPSTSLDWSNGYPLNETPGATFAYTRSA